MGYIKAEYSKNGEFKLEIEFKECISIECLVFANTVAKKALNRAAQGNERLFNCYKGALIEAIDMLEFNNHE